ncbi:toxin-activating lysine-acyltransferase [Curvivirga sp.]|uniref:toxin-activating lysine-acyltransferase n=1 Tax=Curvivirga sp. TaxID=2856848 RepID=UPI003B5ADDF1
MAKYKVFLSDFEKSALADIQKIFLQSDYHKKWSQNDFIRLVLPPVRLNQCRIFREEGEPVAFLSWAWMNKASEKRYLSLNDKLQPKDWKSGKNLWLIDVICLNGQLKKIANQMSKDDFKFISMAKAARFGGKDNMTRIHLIRNPNFKHTSL